MAIRISTAESSIADKLLAFCDKYIPLIEQKLRRRMLATLTRRLQRAMRNHFEQREKEILHRIEWAWKAKMEAVSTIDWILLHAFDYDEEMELLRVVLGGFYIEAGEWGANHLLRSVGSQIGRDVIYRGSTSWIKDHAIEFGEKYADMITETTNQAIRDEIGEAIAMGDDLDKAMDRIASVYSDAQGYRSEMIARTEMARAYNSSALEQAKALGIKQYNWVGCDPSCPICGPFMAGGPYSAAEIEDFIASTHPNCVGGQVPVVPEDFTEPIP